MKRIGLALVFFLLLAGACLAGIDNLVIDGFEGAISGGPEGTVDFGAGNGSSVQVTGAKGVKYAGDQSLKIDYDAVAGGYIYVAKGWGLDAKNAGWLVKPEAIDWGYYKAITFEMYGSGSNAKFAFDVKDNGNELWRFVVEDNFQGWKKIICAFKDFSPRSDWQPESADKNGIMDFPLKSYQFEPLPAAKGTVYFDEVTLIK